MSRRGSCGTHSPLPDGTPSFSKRIDSENAASFSPAVPYREQAAVPISVDCSRSFNLASALRMAYMCCVAVSRGGPLKKVNLQDAFSAFTDVWSPKVAGDINDAQVKLAKFRGPFHWHHHDLEDELFLVVAGRLRMGFRDNNVDLEPGEFIIVPRGVEHRPEALSDECHVLLLEPNTTLNTGNVENERTIRQLDRIA